jgi:hypothetical protein
LTKAKISQVLSTRLPNWKVFSECLAAHLPKVLLAILYVKGLDVMFLNKKEL